MPRKTGKAHLSEQQDVQSPSPFISLSGGLTTQLEACREFINTLPVICWRANVQTFQLTFVSQYAEKLLGYSPQTWIDDPLFWKEHVYPEDREFLAERRAEALKSSEGYDVEYRLMSADGKIRWVRELAHACEDSREITGVIIDLSHKRSEREVLGEDKRWLRQVVDSIPVQIWSGPSDGTVDFVNARWRGELGFTLEQIQSDEWQEMLHPDDRDRVLNAWQESVVNGTRYEQQERHRMATGEYRWFLCRGIPLRGEDGNIVRWFGSNTDIDQQKRAEDALRWEEQRWRAVFENSSVGITLLDRTGRFLVSNAAFEKMLGYSSGELKKLRYQDVVYSEDLVDAEKFFAAIWEGKSPQSCVEKRNYRKDGSFIWTRCSGSLVAEAGVPQFEIFIAEDITERKRLEDELRRERDRLRLLLDLNHQFITKLDHREFFDALLRALRHLAGWDWASILLPQPGSERLMVYPNTTNELFGEGTTISIDGSLSGRVYRSGKAATFGIEELPDLSAEYRRTPWMQERIRDKSLESGCVLPLIFEGHVLGVLLLMSRGTQDWAISELDFLQELAKLVAAALKNSLQFDQMNISHAKLVSERRYVEDQVRNEAGFDEIIGKSSAIKSVLRQVEAVAPTDSTVLITGETGTGKELIARAIHDHSPRQYQSFIKVDCVAIPATLMESELFGHEKGAFTGATSAKIGRFEAADQGTLFLDEVGDIPIELQSKLLRVLQDHAFERLGSNRTRHVDVRIVAATNRDLESLVESGKFREDLFYRLKVFPITIPPLRERETDIPLLVQHYVRKYARRMKKDVSIVPAVAMEVFMRYPWPGNVRELQHFIERSVVISSGKVLHAPVLELERLIRKQQIARRQPATGRTLVEIERESILQALEEADWIVGGPHGAASKLGMKRTTLASRMEKLGISRRRRK